MRHFEQVLRWKPEQRAVADCELHEVVLVVEHVGNRCIGDMHTQHPSLLRNVSPKWQAKRDLRRPNTYTAPLTPLINNGTVPLSLH